MRTMSTNTTEMELENRTQSAIIWTNSNGSAWGCSQNASLYVIMPEDKEGLRDCSPCVLESELDEFLEWKWWVCGFIMAIFGILGLVGNLMSLAVLMRPKIRDTSFNQLLAVMCIVDSLFIACNIMSCLQALGVKNANLKFFRGLMDSFAQVWMCFSVLMIVALTFERHFAIRSPHRYRIHIRTTDWWKHLGYYVVPVTILSLFFNIPMFINLQESWKTNTDYVKVNLYLRMLHPLTTTGLVPMLLLLILNIRITTGIKQLQARLPPKNWSQPETTQGNLQVVNTNNDNTLITEAPLKLQQGGSAAIAGASASGGKKMSKSQQQNRREIRMAYLTFVIVTLFFVLHMPRILCAAYEVSNTWKIVRCVNGKVQYMPEMTFYRWDQVSFLLMVISSSMNFLIYCTGSDQFKNEFFELFVPNILQRQRDQSLKANVTTQTTTTTITTRTSNMTKNKTLNPSPQIGAMV